jgi:adenylate kinase
MAGRVVILGAPGAGKGTQARRIAKKYGWPHISTGDIFRSHLEERTAIGQKIESYMRNGKLVPDELACQIVVERLAQSDCANGYILDGFPRSLPQAQALDNVLADRKEALDVVILLDVDDEEIVARLSGRRTCPNCGKIYNLKFNPPKNDLQCDKPGCEGANLVHREDDREETVRNRINVYHETTEPLIQYYERAGVLRRIDGAGHTLDNITERIEAVLDAREAV